MAEASEIRSVGSAAPAEIVIQPCGPVRGEIRPPGSKSITNRALICAALAPGESILTGALRSDDTQVMIAALRSLGLPIDEHDHGRRLRIGGPIDWSAAAARSAPGRPPIEIFVGNSGTTIRFLTAMLATGRGRFRLDGVPRMRERPIEDLLAALRAQGTTARSERDDNCPPVLIEADGLAGGETTVRGDISSQFLSGLLIAAPRAKQPLTIRVDGPLVSQPYIAMTTAVMRSFGVEVAGDAASGYAVPRQNYRPQEYAVEPDASAASYFFAAAAVTGGSAVVRGLSRNSLQGDVAFVDVLARMGCRVEYGPDSITVSGSPQSGIEVDMNAISDTVQTLGAVALFAPGPVTVTGVGHIRHKETDRIAALATELRKLGAVVVEWADGLRIEPPSSGRLRGAAIDTYDDHRMAMSLALAGLRIPGVVIRDPGCTAKTYPEFFADLKKLQATAGGAL